MKLSLNYPVTTFKVNQEFGIYRPEVYSQFGFNRHNGIDIALGSDSMIYAPLDGQIIRIGNQPKGGGIFFGFLSDRTFTFDDGISSQVLIDFLHLDHIIGKITIAYKAGDLLAKADNTGFSTGSHTHMQFRRVRYDGKVVTTIDVNDANNSFDPKPYWNGTYPNSVQTTQPVAVSALPVHFVAFQKALNDFQVKEGIKPFDLVGPATRRALNKYLKIKYE